MISQKKRKGSTQMNDAVNWDLEKWSKMCQNGVRIKGIKYGTDVKFFINLKEYWISTIAFALCRRMCFHRDGSRT